MARGKLAAAVAADGESPEALMQRYLLVARIVVPAPIALGVIADPGDDRVLACAVAGGAELIVSGDADLLDLKAYQGIEIITAVEALTRLPQRRPEHAEYRTFASEWRPQKYLREVRLTSGTERGGSEDRRPVDRVATRQATTCWCAIVATGKGTGLHIGRTRNRGHISKESSRPASMQNSARIRHCRRSTRRHCGGGSGERAALTGI